VINSEKVNRSLKSNNGATTLKSTTTTILKIKMNSIHHNKTTGFKRNMKIMRIVIIVGLMSEEVETEAIEETEAVMTEEGMIIRRGLPITTTTIKKGTQTPEEDINHEVMETTEAIEVTEEIVAIVEEVIRIIATNTTTRIIKMKISTINHLIQILRNSSSKKIKETLKSSKETVEEVAVEEVIRKIMIIMEVETKEEMTNISITILDQGEAMAKINIKTITITTQIIKTLKVELIHSTEILRQIRIIMSFKEMFSKKKLQLSTHTTVITIRIIKNQFDNES
jgi:hypothetical protein